MREQILAILWAQWKSVFNYFPKSKIGGPIAIIVSLLWYGLWAFGAVSIGLLCADSDHALLNRLLPSGLLLMLLYWQVIPLMMASTGNSLELRKLVVYPIPHAGLFAIEAALRITSAAEMILVLCGAAVGLLFNRRVPAWGVAALIAFGAFNLFLSEGIRELLGRLLSRKRVREVLVFAFVIMMVLPQLMFVSGSTTVLRRIMMLPTNIVWPWAAAAKFAIGESGSLAALSISIWTAAALVFARSQFERSLRFDAGAAAASTGRRANSNSFVEHFYRLPSRLLTDPLGAMIEKELRFLTRSPRFRLVFLMGFSFGLIIWMPIMLRSSHDNSSYSAHFLTAVTVYSLMLLGEVCIWNVFGFDRSAVQVYFAVPVRMTQVLMAKNITALVFILLESVAITLICIAVRLPVTPAMLVEAIAVTITMSIYLLAIGNMLSVRSPRAVDPDQSWRRSAAGKVQTLLLLIYFIVAIPVALAYGARYALETDVAFYAVLLFDAMVGAVIYWVAMDSALQTATNQKEAIITVLSQGAGPIG